MAINYVPLDKEKHKDLKIAVNNSFKYAKDTHLAAATIKEFAQLASTMPIVLIKDPGSDRYHVVAMLGMEQSQNLFLTGDSWKGPHVPSNVLRYPFDVRPDGDKLGVFIDENSDSISEEGQPLFTADGEASDFLKNRQQFLADLANSELLTQRFVQKIVELDLLDPIQIRLTYQSGQQRNVTGMLSINEKKLMELPEETVLELHKSGFLGALYALMMSLGQLNRLVELSNDTENPIRSMQLSVAKDEEAPAAQ
ncbi:SapC family protein [Alteromonas sp. KUL49]|uniref:SapC family protein n=1 Tax=Alteromonas sp. KUL49 TaxID=2480798 RepID=UPI00102EF47F|nr:SapC family protein [Alteromonas sp. KUL49]TAP41594.1 SapC protein [Alteromonas sp. KUL49]GEA10691.1 SapC [Alteromonas sp. KUL49]